MPAARRLAAVTTAVTVGTVVLGLAAAVGPAAPAAALTRAVAPTYAVNEPLCSEPTDPNAARCLALKQRIVPRGTPGSYRVATTGSVNEPAGGTGDTAGTAAAKAFGGYTPRQLATAYRFNPKLNRRNLTVGIVLWHDAPNVLRDLNVFNRANRLPAETARSFRKVNAAGKTSPLPKRDRGTAGEVALDTQAVRGVCNTCRILLVEADGPYGKDLAKAVNTAVRLGATIVTNSYGVPEHRMAASFVRAYQHPGVAMLAATGDAGWFGWDYANGSSNADNAALFPATSPHVIAVGGTTLQLQNGRRTSEKVWNRNGAHNQAGATRKQPLGAGGGGCSKVFNAPAWQLRTPGYAAAHCRGKRLAADMAMVADPYTGYRVYDSYGSGGWIVVGGTSLSSPLAAGMLALAGGPQGSRYPATAVYGSAAARRGARVDVMAGGTGFCGGEAPKACAAGTKAGWGTNNPNKLGAGAVDCSFPRSNSEAIPTASSRECNAARGYDGPSGVGVPYSTRLFLRTDPFLTVRWKGRVERKHREKFTASVRTPVGGTRITSLRWSWGDRKTTTTTKRSVSHRYAKAGRFTITLTSRDSRGQTVVYKRKVTVR